MMDWSTINALAGHPQHAVVMRGDSFEVIHRRQAYGCFTYEWASDLSGVELLFEREKFGEICNPEQFSCDLSGLGMPHCVRCVVTITLGCLVRELGSGLPLNERIGRLREELDRLGYDNFDLYDVACD